MTTNTLKLYRATQTLFRAFHYLQPRMSGGTLAPPQPMNAEALAGCILHGCMSRVVRELRLRRERCEINDWRQVRMSAGAPTYDHNEVTMKTQSTELYAQPIAIQLPTIGRKDKATMKSQLRFAALSLMMLLCLMLSAARASADTLYDNGPINGNADAWQINFGYTVSDTFALGKAAQIKAITAGAWEFPGNTVSTLGWSITSAENGGTVYGSGIANVTDTFLSVNEYGYNIDQLSLSGLNVNLDAGTYWLNLSNASTPSGDPVYWDENSGIHCGGQDGDEGPCPSLASESALGTIPGEAFTIEGGSGGGNTPEPSSLALFGSGVVGIGGLLRQRFFG